MKSSNFLLRKVIDYIFRRPDPCRVCIWGAVTVSTLILAAPGLLELALMSLAKLPRDVLQPTGNPSQPSSDWDYWKELISLVVFVVGILGFLVCQKTRSEIDKRIEEAKAEYEIRKTGIDKRITLSFPEDVTLRQFISKLGQETEYILNTDLIDDKILNICLKKPEIEGKTIPEAISFLRYLPAHGRVPSITWDPDSELGDVLVLKLADVGTP